MTPIASGTPTTSSKTIPTCMPLPRSGTGGWMTFPRKVQDRDLLVSHHELRAMQRNVQIERAHHRQVGVVRTPERTKSESSSLVAGERVKEIVAACREHVTPESR